MSAQQAALRLYIKCKQRGNYSHVVLSKSTRLYDLVLKHNTKSHSFECKHIKMVYFKLSLKQCILRFTTPSYLSRFLVTAQQ